MKFLFSVLFFACLPGLCAAADSSSPAKSGKVERAAAKSRITYKGGDGSSFEKAVLIVGAKSSVEGVPAERVWLEKKYREYEKIGQALEDKDGRSYDLITIKTKRGKVIVVYFDISEFLKGNLSL